MVPRLTGGQPLPATLSGAVVALGNFDGFHLGHQAVVAQAVAVARTRGVPAIVATFDPLPVAFFRPQTPLFRLTTLDQRQSLLGDAGVDAMLVFGFDEALARATPAEFVKHWLRGAGAVVTGSEFSFGKGRAGDTHLLAELCGQQGMTAHAVGPVTLAGQIISSSRIRDALRMGDCATAAMLLTRPFAIAGTLAPGKRMDPALTMLDASLDLGDYLRPRAGVHAARARLADGRLLGGSAYLDPRAPSESSSTLELFLVDLSHRDVGTAITIELVAHLHDADENYEPEALRAKIADDRRKGSQLVAAGLFDR